MIQDDLTPPTHPEYDLGERDSFIAGQINEYLNAIDRFVALTKSSNLQGELGGVAKLFADNLDVFKKGASGDLNTRYLAFNYEKGPGTSEEIGKILGRLEGTKPEVAQRAAKLLCGLLKDSDMPNIVNTLRLNFHRLCESSASFKAEYERVFSVPSVIKTLPSLPEKSEEKLKTIEQVMLGVANGQGLMVHEVKVTALTQKVSENHEPMWFPDTALFVPIGDVGKKYENCSFEITFILAGGKGRIPKGAITRVTEEMSRYLKEQKVGGLISIYIWP